MFNGVARMLWMEPLYDPVPCCTNPVSHTDEPGDKLPHVLSSDSNTLSSHAFSAVECSNGDNGGPWRPNVSNLRDIQSTLCDLLHVQLRSIQVVLETISDRQEAHEARVAWEAEIHSEWKYLASVLDRLFFITYLIAIVISLGFLFPRPV